MLFFVRHVTLGWPRQSKPATETGLAGSALGMPIRDAISMARAVELRRYTHPLSFIQRHN
jgi:hypothetical protein